MKIKTLFFHRADIADRKPLVPRAKHPAHDLSRAGLRHPLAKLDLPGRRVRCEIFFNKIRDLLF